jgi:hypothetical protein
MIAVDSVLTALVNVATTALPSVQVLDGWNGQTDRERTLLIIGFDPQQGSPVVTTSAELDEGSLCDTLDVHTVTCTLATWDGDMEFPVKRGALSGHLGTLHDAIFADQSLGVEAFDAWIAPDMAWFQVVQQSTKDSAARATVQVDFSITVRIYRK